jgi:glycosyltransferase involved in cell wall biosynthesis
MSTGINKFAVITVVKNDIEGLKKTRDSIEGQDYSNWAHIIVDGMSSDGTVEYLGTLPKENTIFISENDSGIYNAMNKGWKMASPDEFVIFLNARDLFAYSDSLKKINEAFALNSTSVWGCGTHEEIERNGEGWVSKLVSEPSLQNQLYAHGYRSHQAVVMKAEFIAKLNGFDEKYKLAADWDLISRALIKIAPIEWDYPVAIFELGGFSDGFMLDAHKELIQLRRKYIPKKITWIIYEKIWCSIYLKQFGYRNIFTIVFQIIKIVKKINHLLWKKGIDFPLAFQIIKIVKKINHLLWKKGIDLTFLNRKFLLIFSERENSISRNSEIIPIHILWNHLDLKPLRYGRKS